MMLVGKGQGGYCYSEGTGGWERYGKEGDRDPGRRLLYTFRQEIMVA